MLPSSALMHTACGRLLQAQSCAPHLLLCTCVACWRGRDISAGRHSQEPAPSRWRLGWRRLGRRRRSRWRFGRRRFSGRRLNRLSHLSCSGRLWALREVGGVGCGRAALPRVHVAAEGWRAGAVLGVGGRGWRAASGGADRPGAGACGAAKPLAAVLQESVRALLQRATVGFSAQADFKQARIMLPAS